MSKEKWFFLILMVTMNIFLVISSVVISVLAGHSILTGLIIFAPFVLPFAVFCIAVWYIQFKLWTGGMHK